MDNVCKTALTYDPLIGESESIEKLKSIISEIAALDTTVMIYGEPGAGKETVARMIHANGPHARKKFIAVHAAALPDTLQESVLFGDDMDPSTSARKNQKGYFDTAGIGSIFINDIDALAATAQFKLLRILQNNRLDHNNGSKSIQPIARLIAATNKNLKKLVKNGDFRPDLFYRLNFITLEIPPLRERREDIPLLVKYFIQKYSKKFHTKGLYIPPESVASLQHYHWPGNVRELENIISRFIVLSGIYHTGVSHFPSICNLNHNACDQRLPSADAQHILQHEKIITMLMNAQDKRLKVPISRFLQRHLGKIFVEPAIPETNEFAIRSKKTLN